MDPYIAAYHNDPTSENLCKLVAHTYSCKFITVAWYLGNLCWYVPVVLDTHIDDNPNTNNGSGWYISDELTVKNIPIRHSKINQSSELKTKTAKILYANIAGVPNSDDTTNSDGSSVYVHFAICAWLDKLYSDDMLKRQKFRQELMLSNISHSVRTPLNGILHMTRTLMTIPELKNIEDPRIYETLQYLNQSSVSLATNIFDIIDLTKLELGKLILNKDIFNIRDMLESTMELANTFNKSEDVEINMYIDDSVPEYIYSDSKRVKQILINLLENALQHTKAGEVNVHVCATVIDLASENKSRDINLPYQYMISFIIKDTGTGIAASIKESLFKPLEILTSSKDQGLSLRISYLLAKYLNGGVKLIESSVGTGSCFEFHLVVCDEEPPVVYSKTLQDLKNKSVLLIDTTNSHNSVCSIFERYQMKFIVASDIREISILHTNKPFNLVIIKAHEDSGLISTVKSLFQAPILYMADTHSKSVDYFISIDSDESDIKLKLIDIFNNRCEIQRDSIHILVVEDEQISRIVMEKILRGLGFTHITLTANGEEALKLYARQPTLFDLVLCNIRMPLMSGFELADKIYKINPNAKMIGITAQVIIDDDLKPWFNEFIYKPINPIELHKKIMAVL